MKTLLKIKNFFLEKNLFKEFLSSIVSIPSFALGFFGTEMFDPIPHPSLKICLIIVSIGFIWVSWTITYIFYKHNKQ